MAAKIAGINPEILKWARERAGLSLQQVAHSIQKDVEILRSWESGKSSPTYIQLETLAYRHYKRPLAIFFFPSPPEEDDPKAEFRLLPPSELDALKPSVLFLIRQARSMQESLKDLTDGVNPAPSKIFQDIDATRFSSLGSLCERVRSYLGVDLETQMSWLGIEEAFKNWREALQAHGIFVFKRPFRHDEISGFCLADKQFPIICINNSTSISRQIFSLFHELAHLLYSVSGVTKVDTSYVTALPSRDRRIEVVCNRFAGAFLVPDKHFDQQLKGFNGSGQEIEILASRYGVSREVILRKLLDRGRVDQSAYEDQVRRWNEEYASRPKGKGGDYYATQAAYLGQPFLRLAFSRYYEGRCSLQELAEHLGMRAKHVPRLEDFLARGA